MLLPHIGGHVVRSFGFKGKEYNEGYVFVGEP